uniref:FAD dependent oxidoreductase domain-containing protein n=1 Tax=Kalanchoe fedtschenkoi TaxID=63787 RepID=A0A7N0RG48_KALFE
MAEARTLRNPNPSPATFPARNASHRIVRKRGLFLPVSSSSSSRSSSSYAPQSSLRYAVLGAGFAGLSVAYHLLKHSPRDSRIRVDIYDEVGLGGGASGVSGGLVHPYSPKAKLLWRGKECWEECLELLRVAEEAAALDELSNKNHEIDGFIIRRRGILRPAMSMKNFDVLNENARNCLPSCRIERTSQDAARNLIPYFSTPCNAAFYLPEAVNINPQRYIQALFLACQNLVQEASGVGLEEKELHLHKSSINKLTDLAHYTAVIVCAGAQADSLPELSSKLPLRTCRGVVAHMRLPESARNGNIGESPSILSDAWLAVQNSSSLYMGATWDWNSRNYSRDVSADEASRALVELLSKASVIYPSIKDWTFSGAMGGVRAMPPLTANNGSLPLLGSIDNFVTGNGNEDIKFWLFGGLGSRGLLYHALLGKLTANAVLSCNEKLIPSELISWKKPYID